MSLIGMLCAVLFSWRTTFNDSLGLTQNSAEQPVIMNKLLGNSTRRGGKLGIMSVNFFNLYIYGV